jgi:organic hydroperoxide reductase OsmC/OhrA
LAAYSATIHWQRGDQVFTDGRYSRAHAWQFDGGLEVPASASPHIVPPPFSSAGNLDPEEAFVAALSSCHMLFFLSLAAKRGIVVDEYLDEAVGHMGEDEKGRTVMLKIVLRPKAVYAGDAAPSRERLEALHHRAHELCYLANSVRCEVLTEIVS